MNELGFIFHPFTKNGYQNHYGMGMVYFRFGFARFLILEAVVMYWSLHRRFITKKMG